MTTEPLSDHVFFSSQTETQLQMLIDGVTDYAIYLLDPSGYVASWNAGAKRIKGYERKDIVGKHFERFYTSEDRSHGEPMRNLAQAADLGRLEAEGWRVRSDGSHFWAHIIVQRITSQEGSILGFAKITRDLTGQREAQRTLDAAREALLQTQKLEALGKLTGGVAHEFNNLLMAIQSTIDLIKVRHSADPGTDKLIRIALKSVARGAGLTRKMLGFARRQTLRPVALDVPSVIDGMMDLLRATAGPRVNVATQMPPSVPPVYIDPEELELALLNLVANARDALEDGGHIVLAVNASEISSAAELDRAGGWYLCLSVTDDGAGMQPAVLSRATEPFFSTKAFGSGSGLGLSAVEGLAGQSGGWLALYSEAGLGTRAEIWLPAMGAANGVTRAPVSLRENDAGPASASLGILLLDDDPLVLQTVAALLEDLGHNVAVAQSGQQAIDWLESGIDCNVMITDYAMPGATGTMVAQRARAQRPGLPIIVMTGYAEIDGEDIVGAERLTKPFDRRDLAAALARVTA